MLWIGVAIGCAIGAMARFALSLLSHRWRFPWHTLIANTLAAALVGAVAGAPDLSEGWQLALGVGLGGGLSTFSTLAVDAVNEFRRSWRAGTTYLALTFALGVAAAWAGFMAAEALA